MNMQRFVLPLLITILFIINRIALCNSAKFPDDGYVNPPPPPAEGYDVPEEPNEGYDAPSYEEETKDPCFSYDTDSPLNDIKPSPYATDGAFGAKDIYECQKLCQRVYDCNYFVFDNRLFGKKCWLKTSKSFILPPVAGTILGPKSCDVGYQPPNDSGIAGPYDAPPPPRANYEEPEIIYAEPNVADAYEVPLIITPTDNYQEPEENYQEPNIADSYDLPVVKHNEPTDNYEEPDTSYEEPDYKGGCFSANTDSPFADLSTPGKPFSKNTQSASECQLLCQQNNNCNNFVHDSKKDWCWLKTNANNQKAQEGNTLGPKYCNKSNKPANIHPRGSSKRSGRVNFSSAGA